MDTVTTKESVKENLRAGAENLAESVAGRAAEIAEHLSESADDSADAVADAADSEGSGSHKLRRLFTVMGLGVVVGGIATWVARRRAATDPVEPEHLDR